MRKLLLVLAAGLIGLPVFAADASKEEKSSVDTSRNPITGSTTTTKKYKRKAKNADGANTSVEMTDKTKVKKDGTVEHTTDAERVNEPTQKDN